MDSKFSQTPSRGEKFKELALSALRAFGYGCLTAAGMSAVIFAFAYFTSGMDMFTGIDWVRRVMYVISSLGIIVCGVGLLFSGKEYEDRQMGFTRDIDDPISLKEGKDRKESLILVFQKSRPITFLGRQQSFMPQLVFL